MTIKLLRECLRHAPRKVTEADYDSMSTDELLEILLNTQLKLWSEVTESKKVDAFRALSWHVNAALTRKSICPSSRNALGKVPTRPNRLSEKINQADAPYIDLLWLGTKHPKLLPRRLKAISDLMCTTIKTTRDADDILIGELIPIGKSSSGIDAAFDAADAFIRRKLPIADKCRTLHMPPWIQSEMRWLCSRSTKKLVKELRSTEADLMHTMSKSGIKQLTREDIENRTLLFRAWKLVGGGTKWQETSDALYGMTGRKITRQGVRDALLRMSNQKFIRMRRGRKKTLKPLISDV